MGKITGFLEIKRVNHKTIAPLKRILNFNEFYYPIEKETRILQGARCMDCGIPFCQSGQVIRGSVTGCPLHNLIPEWNDLLFHGRDKQAFERLLKTNNFPEFTGRVCPALCEAACTCSLHGDAVTIKDNECGIIEEAYQRGWMQPSPPIQRINKKIAIIGSGPTGLAAADQLNKRGYHVTVYERDDRIGGLLMYGIPNMKLEKHIIERRQGIMEAEGIIFKTNCNITSKQQADKILQEYDRVILACGARQPRSIAVKNSNAKGIYYAVDYLSAITKSLLDSNLQDNKCIETKDKRVLVIGGGDTGNDCVGSAIRLGCKSIIQLEMMPALPLTRAKDNSWPEWPRIQKVDYGQEESIAVFNKDPRQYQKTVIEFIVNDAYQVVQAVICDLEKKQQDGRIIMVPIKGTETVIDVDLVLIAAGFIGCQEDIAKAFNVAINVQGVVEQKEYQTKNKKVYVAGDMKTGQSLVVHAIHEGREVAKQIDKDIMGYTNL